MLVMPCGMVYVAACPHELSLLQTLKYIRNVPGMEALFSALVDAVPDMSIFLLIFFLIFFAFTTVPPPPLE